MTYKWWSKAPHWAATLFMVFVLGSCDDSSTVADNPFSPVTIQASKGGDTYTFVNAGYALTNPLSVSKLIDITGGEITVLGHTLSVPAGAVATLTIFTMTALPGGKIEVDLLALAPILLTDIGVLGFNKPVTLTLSYAGTPDNVDPKRLVIVHVRTNGDIEPRKTTVDKKDRTASAKLDHFSKYCLASN